MLLGNGPRSTPTPAADRIPEARKRNHATDHPPPPPGWIHKTKGEKDATVSPPAPILVPTATSNVAPYPNSSPIPQQLHNSGPIPQQFHNSGPILVPTATSNVTPYPNSGPVPQQLQYTTPNASLNQNPQYFNHGPSMPYYGPVAPVPQYFNHGFVPAPNYVPVAPFFPDVNTFSFGDFSDGFNCDCD